MALTVDDSGVISTFTGFAKILLANFTISGGIVAEKNKDCLLAGNLAIILFTSFINPISSILSASSRTNIFKLCNKIYP